MTTYLIRCKLYRTTFTGGTYTTPMVVRIKFDDNQSWNNTKSKLMAKKREIRNSTAEFLTFVAEGKENGIQVLYKDEAIWATQKAMATLFDVGVPAINKHLKNIFDSGELMVDSVISKMETTVSKMEIVQIYDKGGLGKADRHRS